MSLQSKILRVIISFLRTDYFPYLLIFLLGVILRVIPELIISDYPIGFETITYYAPAMFTFSEKSIFYVFNEFFGSGPLFYILMWFAVSLNLGNPFIILKIVGPILFGLLSISFFLFLKNGLKLEKKVALVGAVLLVFQIAILRVSWDRFRNILALIFVFATITEFKSDHKFKWWTVSIFSVLIALSREYIALVLFVSVLGFAVLQKKERLLSLISMFPAFAIFGIMNLQELFQRIYIPTSQFSWNSYFSTLQDALIIFIICFLPLLPFVLKGFRRDKLLEPMLFLLLLGSSSFFISPWIAGIGYQRWMMLLVFPFTVYAIYGFERFGLFNRNNLKKLLAIFSVFIVLGVSYSSGPLSYVLIQNSWVPTNLIQSSIGWNQIDDLKEVLVWFDENAETNSSLLSEERFYGWTLIYLVRANKDIKVMPYGANSLPETALEKALKDGFQRIYLIGYTNSKFDSFNPLYSQNEISIFQYQWATS